MDDGATIITDTLKEDAEEQESMGCAQKTLKVLFALMHGCYNPSAFV